MCQASKCTILLILAITLLAAASLACSASQSTPTPAAMPLATSFAKPTSPPEQPIVVSRQSRIAFTSNRDGNDEIYVMNADGSNQTRLTNNPFSDSRPTWSSDGKRLAFVSDRDGNAEIYMMNVDGTGQMNLTSNLAEDKFPTWSPDGRQIAFTSDRDGNREIYVVNTDGSNLRRLTNDKAVDFVPAWSPNGREIAFLSTRNYKLSAYTPTDIFVVNADGGGLTNLSGKLGRFIFSLAWSPNGHRIALECGDPNDRGICVMDVQEHPQGIEGEKLIRLTSGRASDDNPTWSPDGLKIAFESYRDGNGEIYVMNSDGSGQINLTNNPSDDGFPAWQP